MFVYNSRYIFEFFRQFLESNWTAQQGGCFRIFEPKDPNVNLFAAELLGGRAKIPAGVDARTALVLKEICRLGMRLRTDDGEEITVSPDDFRKYWKKAREETSSSTCGIHFGHYRAATKSDKITKFLSQKVTVIARTGLPPERWDNRLQVMLEKIAGIALVNKLRAILLMEAEYNFFNRWQFIWHN